MTNGEIAKLLRNVAASYAIKDEKKYRFQIIAYERAADAIEGSTSEIKDLINEGKLELLPGVGPSINSHLNELLTTGKVKHFEWAMKDIPQSVFTLLDIPTFGPKKSYKLTVEFKLNDPKTVINDLEKLAKSGEIAKLEGFGEKSQADILRAIKEFMQGYGKTRRMVLPFASELADKIVLYLKKKSGVIQVEPLGSLRRKKETVGDIDIAVTAKNAEKVIEYFIKYPYTERVIEKGPTTSSILTSGGKQIDLIVLPPESFGSLLQHFTGSKNHNVHLREYALKKGLSLSERGIKHKMENGKWKMENYLTEEAFYKALGLAWIPPELREDQGEVELAVKNKLPELLEQKDIKGDLHIHSNFPIEPSHDMGFDSMETMLKKAEESGYEYLGFSEHNPSVSKHSEKDIYSIILRKKQKIEQLNKSNKYIRAINLLETDILSTGNLSISDLHLDLLDATIVSIHSSFSMGIEKMTERVIKGLSHPKAKILAHPTGRLINQRPGYELDWEKLFDFCAKNNKALEINSWPERLDLPDSLIKYALSKKVKCVINTDSHAVSQMDMMKYGVYLARRGWATKHDILNTLSYNKFNEWLKS